MGRKKRDVRPGIHHICARGNNRADLFDSDDDRGQYLIGVALAMDAFSARCLSYCLMPNHVHLLVETTKPNLPWIVWSLHGGHARYLNRERGGVGHVFATRYVNTRAEDEPTAGWLASYVANNPVKHGFCADPSEWEWSSHRAVLGLDRVPRWLDVKRLLALFGRSVDRYAEIVALGRSLGNEGVLAALAGDRQAAASVGAREAR